jgi:hypothetical protein
MESYGSGYSLVVGPVSTVTNLQVANKGTEFSDQLSSYRFLKKIVLLHTVYY